MFLGHHSTQHKDKLSRELYKYYNKTSISPETNLQIPKYDSTVGVTFGDNQLLPNLIVKFIKELYTIIALKELCFLSGAFVFEDPTMKLFNTLIANPDEQINMSNPVYNNYNALNLNRNGFYTKTHNVF
jgi:hypothetical protein